MVLLFGVAAGIVGEVVVVDVAVVLVVAVAVADLLVAVSALAGR
jgi:hypothetical protein